MPWGPRTKGSLLRPAEQAEALARFVHRHTKDHRPAWARHEEYPVQFASDAEWLANTVFRTNKDGTLHATAHCESAPTWPDNPELRTGWLSNMAEAVAFARKALSAS